MSLQLDSSHSSTPYRPDTAAPVDLKAADARQLRGLALGLWLGGRLDEAIAVLTEAALLTPGDAVKLAELGSLLSAAGRPAEARGILDEALRLDPRQTQAWLTLACVCRELGDTAEAERAWLMTLDIAPNLPEALVGLGLLYTESRRYRTAARLLAAAVEAGAASLALFACLGQAQAYLGEFEKSRIAFESARRIAPDQGVIVRRHAFAALVEAALTAPAEDALALYQNLAGDDARPLDDIGHEAFHVLAGYRQIGAALRFGRYILERCPDDVIVGFQVDALLGRAHRRAPDAYLRAMFDKYAQKFDWHVGEVLEYRVPQQCAKLLVEAGAKGARVLDLGCGTGIAATHLQSVAREIVGVDLSPAMLQLARDRGLYAELVESEAVAWLSKAKRVFDVVIALDTLIYFGDLSNLFDVAAARLAPGGLFAFSYETQEQSDWTLLPSGRFAHNPAYVDALASALGFETVSILSTTIRLEANEPVPGRVVLLRRK